MGISHYILWSWRPASPADGRPKGETVRAGGREWGGNGGERGKERGKEEGRDGGQEEEGDKRRKSRNMLDVANSPRDRFLTQDRQTNAS